MNSPMILETVNGFSFCRFFGLFDMVIEVLTVDIFPIKECRIAWMGDLTFIRTKKCKILHLFVRINVKSLNIKYLVFFEKRGAGLLQHPIIHGRQMPGCLLQRHRGIS